MRYASKVRDAGTYFEETLDVAVPADLLQLAEHALVTKTGVARFPKEVLSHDGQADQVTFSALRHVGVWDPMKRRAQLGDRASDPRLPSIEHLENLQVFEADGLETISHMVEMTLRFPAPRFVWPLAAVLEMKLPAPAGAHDDALKKLVLQPDPLRKKAIRAAFREPSVAQQVTTCLRPP